MGSVSRFLLGLLLLAPGLASAFEFQPSARLNAQGSYSSIPPTADWGALGDVFLVPAMRQGNWTVIPLFAALGQTADKSVLEDAFFVESYTFMAKPTLAWSRDGVTLKVFGVAKRTINKETPAELWSTGRYDYEEYGVGLGGEWKSPLRFLGTTSATVEMLHRSYPNYHELTTLDNRDYYSKDYDGWKVDLETAAPQDNRLQWSLGYTLLMRNFTDALFVNTDGTLDLSTLRHDQLHRVSAGLQGLWSEKLAWSTLAGFDMNVSNEGYFDQNFLVFNPDFYGYYSESLGGGLTWMPWGLDGPSLSPGYTFILRNYTGRLVRNPDGSFTLGKQADTEHDVTLSGRWPWRKWLAFTGGVDYDAVQSNQGFVSAIRNTYDVFRVRLGVDLRY
jgi:hypothetical protein